MNLTEIRAVIRRDLKDEATPYRWSNDELDRHTGHAVKDFSEELPLEAKATLATVSGSREIDITSLSDRVMVQAVEYPAGRFPRCYQRFSLWKDCLTLLGAEIPDGSNAHVYYGRLHTLNEAGSTIPAYLEDLITAGAEGYAALEWAVYTVNRVNVGGNSTAQEFINWGKERLACFREELKRLGRRSRIRGRQLYSPYNIPVSKTTDPGP